MYTYETLLHFLHILAAIVRVGSVLTLNVLAVRVGGVAWASSAWCSRSFWARP